MLWSLISSVVAIWLNARCDGSAHVRGVISLTPLTGIDQVVISGWAVTRPLFQARWLGRVVVQSQILPPEKRDRNVPVQPQVIMKALQVELLALLESRFLKHLHDLQLSNLI